MASTTSRTQTPTQFGGGASLINPIQVTGLTNAVTNDVRNVNNGPTTMFGVTVDNTVGTGGSENWLKMYDVSDNAFVAGTSKPICIFPTPLYVASDASIATVGFNCMVSSGMKFRIGCSYLASKEDGDEMAATPDKKMACYFVF